MTAQYSGVSAFAAMHPRFPFDAMLATNDFAAHPAFAVLWGTFGDSDARTTGEIFHRFTQRYHDKPHLIEVHPINNTAIRNKKQYTGEPFPQFDISRFNKALERRDPATLATITARIQEIRAVMEQIRNPNTFLCMTTGLEDDYSPAAFAVMRSTIEAVWPYFLIRSGAQIGGFPREAHGKTAQAGGTVCFVNEDGAVQSLEDSKRFMERNGSALCRLLWRPAHQGRNPNTNDFGKPPRERTFTWTAADVVALGAILRHYSPAVGAPTPVEPVPPAAGSVGGLPVKPCAGGVLWKPESQDTHDAREGKPVIIFKTAEHGKNPLPILAANGAVIGSLGYYGKYEGHGSRYYTGHRGGSGDDALQLQSKAQAAAGSPFVYVRGKDAAYGPIVPNQRTGNL